MDGWRGGGLSDHSCSDIALGAVRVCGHRRRLWWCTHNVAYAGPQVMAQQHHKSQEAPCDRRNTSSSRAPGSACHCHTCSVNDDLCVHVKAFAIQLVAARRPHNLTAPVLQACQGGEEGRVAVGRWCCSWIVGRRKCWLHAHAWQPETETLLGVCGIMSRLDEGCRLYIVCNCGACSRSCRCECHVEASIVKLAVIIQNLWRFAV